MKQISPEEERIREEIRSIYNSGQCDRALDLSRDFLVKFPDSYFAKYSYAVMSGDYAHDIRHSEQEKERLLKIAKIGISELFNSPNLSAYPHRFQHSVKNEYFWFHELPLRQYELGLGALAVLPDGGHYSACVGSGMLALKLISSSNLEEGEDWARKSLYHFYEFEKLSPTWHNINYFGAQAMACLGRYDEALEVYKAMYKKQLGETKSTEVEAFQKHIDEIKMYRNCVSGPKE